MTKNERELYNAIQDIMEPLILLAGAADGVDTCLATQVDDFIIDLDQRRRKLRAKKEGEANGDE